MSTESGDLDTNTQYLRSIDEKQPALSGGKVPVAGPLTDAELAARDPATSAKQDTGNANLSSIDGKLPDQISSRVPVDCHLSEVLSYLLDSIDVAKMSKGAVTTAHNAITATATSAEIDCRGFNSLLVHWVSDQTDKTWTISVTGATGSGLTFVPLLDKATGLAASEITTDISGFFVISNIPDYIKIVCTEVDDGATVTCKVQPFNS